MTYAIEFTARAKRNLEQIYLAIGAAYSGQAQHWFNGLEATILGTVVKSYFV